MSDKTNYISTRQWAASICDCFEELLELHDIDIPDDDRTDPDHEARIYGCTYDDLEEAVNEVLHEMVDEIKRNPNATIDFYNYFEVKKK